ncbi:MAG: hypothetical protein HON90_13315 [Halobacteriovoraceae bacterium]|jgi:hypothetical protein|nr:hypothetical protein [Halobacteriovoraceae bacterium]
MRKIIILLIILLNTNLAFSWVDNCSNDATGSEVSDRYISCVNTNFTRLALKLKLKTDRCYTFGASHNPRYIACVNDNFKKFSTELNTPMQACRNTNIGSRDRYRLNQYFQECVNRTFRQVNRIIINS